jgi:hypothetical protein
MIFKFLKLKRSPPPAPAAKPKPRRKVRADTTIPAFPPEPSSLEVTEGSDHESWSLWEDSVAMMDSQLSSLQPNVKRHGLDESETPTEFQDIEAFARVRHKDP